MKLFPPQVTSRMFLTTVLFIATSFSVYANADSIVSKHADATQSILHALNNVVPAGTTFTEVASLTGVLYGDMEWGDYDNDNDLDVVVTGRISDPGSLSPAVGFTKLYKNTGGVFAEDTDNNLLQLVDGSVAWGDYDNDGDIDLLLTGFIGADIASPATTVYNNVNGALSALPNISIPGVHKGGCNWIDWDNDGDLDIFIAGWTFLNGSDITAISRFYRNTSGVFEVFQYNIQPTFAGDVVWDDSDGDLDFDALVTGLADYTGLWLNNVESPFSSSGSFDALSGSAAVWGDFDSDGDQDLIVSGVKFNTSTGIITLYKNNAGTLTSDGASGLVGHYESSISSGDYDNDGDLDVVLTGFTSPMSSQNTNLFTNDGTGNFTLATSTGLTTPVRSGEAKWGDYDGDGDLDLIVTGSNSAQNTFYTKIYRNDLSASNTAPTVPSALTSIQTDTEVTFSWSAATDAQGGKVTYNLRIGTTPGGSEIMSANSNLATGFHRIAEPGNVKNGLSWRIKKLTASDYYWSVQAIDNAGKASDFATEKQTIIQRAPGDVKADPGHEKVILSWTNPNTTGHFVIYRETTETSTPANSIAASVNGTTYTDASVVNGTIYYYYIKAADINGNSSALKTASATPNVFTEVKSLPYVQYGSTGWGDYDNDGDYDVVVTGFSNPGPSSVKFYTNDGGTFDEVDGPDLTSGIRTYASWNDYDNDNDLDLLITGTTESSTNLYKNTNGTFSLVANTNLPLVNGKTPAWADFDNDGDMDLGLPGTEKKFLMKNNGSDFSQVSELPISTSMVWGDYNNDGDMDYAIVGGGSTGGANPVIHDGIYDNNNGLFTRILTDPYYSAAAVWADIDNDRDLDLIISGKSFSTGLKTTVYRNDISSFVSMAQPNMESFAGDEHDPLSISVGDYDNDGDVDLLIAGLNNEQLSNARAAVYKNNGSGLFSEDTRIGLPQVASPSAAWGDYDNDGDLDVIIYGRAISGSDNVVVNKIIRNNLNAANTVPSVPSNLSVTANGSKTIFSWNASTDAQGGPITYNLRVGTTPGGSEIMSAMSDPLTGKLLTPSTGNVQLNHSWYLNGLEADTYYWSVQAVDGAFAASTFASEQQFVLNAQSISFEELSTVMADQIPFALSASASSGLPVSFASSNLSVATISGNQVTILAAGTTQITASQPGNNAYAAAAPVMRLLTVSKANQTIAFSTIDTRTVGDAPFTLSASASSTLPVQFSTTSDKVTLSGNTVTILKGGSVSITASQEGNTNYNTATSAIQTFCINPAKPTINLTGQNTDNILLTSSAASGNQWYIDGSLLPEATQASIEPISAGVYKVQVSIDGCISEFSNDVPLIVTALVKEENNKHIQLYPNPASDKVVVMIPENSGESTISILSSNGRSCDGFITVENTLEINVTTYPLGIYIIQVYKNGQRYYTKFVKH